jgi:hypothetical protein
MPAAIAEQRYYACSDAEQRYFGYACPDAVNRASGFPSLQHKYSAGPPGIWALAWAINMMAWICGKDE